MHNFAIIEEFDRRETVTYYTLRREDGNLSETDDFLNRMKKESAYAIQFQQMLQWLAFIGDLEKGAHSHFFRPEGNCVALPPNAIHLAEPIDLRLYCHLVSKYIVILYNGGIKTTRTAQNCPNVSRHFYNAQSWTKQLLSIGVETKDKIIDNLDELYLKY